ncbi:hypothetical protein ACVWWK_007684 [Bradyrhizobium sp. LB9.1b]
MSPYLGRQVFEAVQQQLKSNTVKRKVAFSESGALLQGKVFDDKGSLMGPSFSSKNGVRYRFYVSRALRGRKHNAGSVTRISAPEIEALVKASIEERFGLPIEQAVNNVERIVVSANSIQVSLTAGRSRDRQIDIPWTPRPKGTARVQLAGSDGIADQVLLRSIVRARQWLNELSSNRHASIESLADSVGIHPKIVRQGLRLAFLAPDVTSAIVNEGCPVKLKQIPKTLPLAWSDQLGILG